MLGQNYKEQDSTHTAKDSVIWETVRVLLLATKRNIFGLHVYSSKDFHIWIEKIAQLIDNKISTTEKDIASSDKPENAIPGGINCSLIL